MKLALAQINTVVGDLTENANTVLHYCRKAHSLGADLVVFPELTLTGYPPLDLLESSDFIRRESTERRSLAKLIPQKMGMLLGGIAQNSGLGKPLFNAAYLYENGQCVGVRHKQLLPTYDVFDEHRYFAPETKPAFLQWREMNLGIHICEDLWNAGDVDQKLYEFNPISVLASQGADIFINLSASPFEMDKYNERLALVDTIHQRYGLPYVFTNLVGANTDLIFDGQSFVMQNGCILKAPAFEEALLLWDVDQPPKTSLPSISKMEQVQKALILGIRDYVEKTCGFRKVFIGLSGGIDSALTAALAVQALGPERVVGISMPSKYSSKGSLDDARSLASNLKIELHTIPIHSLVEAFDSVLMDHFRQHAPNTAEENVQARIRGTLLMAFANKFQGLVLATGNKSELATGYATLYGDMNGGLAVLGDLYKTEVYELAHFMNLSGTMIPESSIIKAPSAELRPNQTDQDILPSYEILDAILKKYIEKQESVENIIQELGYSAEIVQSAIQRVDRNEYKRWQAAPVLRLRKKAFGSGRKVPIVAQHH